MRTIDDDEYLNGTRFLDLDSLIKHCYDMFTECRFAGEYELAQEYYDAYQAYLH